MSGGPAQRVAIEEFCITGSGGTPSRSNSDYYGGDIPWVKSGELRESIIWKTEETITEEALRKSSAKIVPEGAILLAMYGATVGRLAMLGVDAATNQAVCNIRPDPSKADAKYLYRALEAMVPELISQATGGAQPNISQEKIRKTRIPLPPLDEQKRIASILDKADALRAKRRQAIALFDSLTQSIFLEMLGTSASSTWPKMTINEVASDIRTGPFGSQLLHSEFVDDGIAVLGIDNAVNNRFEWGKARFITEEKYQQLSRYTVRPGDVLITIMGTCGRCAVVPDDIRVAINTKHLCCITLDKSRVLPDYLHSCFLNNRDVLQQMGVQAKGAVMPGLNMGIIKSLSIPVPPIGLQLAFKEQLGSLAQRLGSAEIAANRSEQLFASLQHRAFTGQL